MAGTKFCGSTSRLLLLSVPAFIMLSGAVVTEKSRSCYWCGPLAEQVHRSQRAPACLPSHNHVTTCDPDLPYCAVIATSPPYTESRLCVKLYQDECYPLFCNSTNSWKMTCPCRGDLCNGALTEREDEAFTSLAKLVAKTKNTRIKKRTNAAKFYMGGEQRTVIITNISAVDNNELDNMELNASNNQVTHILLSDDPGVKLDMKVAETSAETTSTSSEVDEGTPTPKVEVEKMDEPIVNTTPETEPKDTEKIEMQKTEAVKDIVKPSEVLPTAEALQQNTTPKAASEKITQTTLSYETTLQTTESAVETTTIKLDKKNKNGQGKLLNNIYIMFINIFYLTFI